MDFMVSFSEASALPERRKFLVTGSRLIKAFGMKTYSDLVDRVFLQEELLRKLIPTEPLNYELVRRIQGAGDADIAGNVPIKNAERFALVRGGVLYALDAIHEAHAIFQDAKGDLGSYWHGMMHRREGDFDNARYWFRRSGILPFFSELHRAASESSALMARQSNWDPYVFTGECEQSRFGETEGLNELLALQRAEFEVLFDYCWRQSVGE
jgi:hypothetical protein